MIGSSNFYPTYPNIYEWDSNKNRIPSDLIALIDDLVAIGYLLQKILDYCQIGGIETGVLGYTIENEPWAG